MRDPPESQFGVCRMPTGVPATHKQVCKDLSILFTAEGYVYDKSILSDVGYIAIEEHRVTFGLNLSKSTLERWLHHHELVIVQKN